MAAHFDHTKHNCNTLWEGGSNLQRKTLSFPSADTKKLHLNFRLLSRTGSWFKSGAHVHVQEMKSIICVPQTRFVARMLRIPRYLWLHLLLVPTAIKEKIGAHRHPVTHPPFESASSTFALAVRERFVVVCPGSTQISDDELMSRWASRLSGRLPPKIVLLESGHVYKKVCSKVDDAIVKGVRE